MRSLLRDASIAAAFALILGSGIGTAPAAAAPPKVVPCPKGQVRVTIAGKAACVLVGRALPVPPPAQTTGSFLIGATLGGRLDHFENKAFPVLRQYAAAPGRFSAGASALSPGIETMAKLARAAAARPRRGAPKLTALAQQSPRLGGGWSAPQTSTSSSGAATTTVATTSNTSNGVTGTFTATGVTPNLPDGTPDFSRATTEMGMKVDAGSAGSFTLAVSGSLGDKVKTNGPCPDSNGRIDMSANTAGGVRTDEQKTMTGLDYIRRNTTTKTSSTFVATVAPDAYLEKTTFDITMNVDTAYALSALNGLLRRNHTMTITAHATGSINGRTGAVAMTSLQIDGTGRSLGASNAAATGAVRSALQGDNSMWAELMSRLAADGQERLKEAEKIWRKPNECVDMKFASASGAQLPPGGKLGVDGKIVAKRDGKPATALWKAPKITRGSLVGAWPGTSLPTKPMHFTSKGAQPNAAGKTFALTTTALSRAGIGSGPWDGTTGGWRVTVTGPVNAQQGINVLDVTVHSTVKSVIDVRQVIKGGVATYQATAPIAYANTSFTSAIAVPCVAPDPPVPVYALSGVAGTTDVRIVPGTGATAATIKVTLLMQDDVSGTLTCPEGVLPTETTLIGTNFFTYMTGPTITVPATGISNTPLKWNSTSPFTASGSLVVKVESL
ncbi:MAG: hypothetical protein ABI912_07710 [Actinomycetota bacterium]